MDWVAQCILHDTPQINITVSDRQRDALIKAVRSKKVYYVEKDNQILWLDFNSIKCFNMMPYIPPDDQNSAE